MACPTNRGLSGCLTAQSGGVGGFPGRLGLQIPSLNGTDGSKFIVRPIPATLIRDGVAMGLQFIKNRRLIVQERDLQPQPATEILHFVAWSITTYRGLSEKRKAQVPLGWGKLKVGGRKGKPKHRPDGES